MDRAKSIAIGIAVVIAVLAWVIFLPDTRVTCERGIAVEAKTYAGIFTTVEEVGYC